LKNKNKILLIGYSNIARKRLISTFIKNKIAFCVASSSYKKKIDGAYEQYNNYNKALRKSDASIVYVSLPNSSHFHWSKKALKYGYHVIVDKPITTNYGELKKLIDIASNNKLMISEATFFNYHNQFKYLKKFCKNLKNINQIHVNFIIPMPNYNSLLLSKKFKGGALMDMSPYAASINRIFFKEKIKKKSIIIKKNNKGLITSFDIFFKYETKVFNGTFKFGSSYENNIIIYMNNKSIEADRIFSPPDNIKLKIKIINKNKLKAIKILKDNCFENYLIEFMKNVNNKNYKFYYKRMIKDENLRFKLIQ